MLGFHAVTPKGTKRFKTPFAAARYIIKLDTTGTIEEEAVDGTRRKVWQRNPDGAWDSMRTGE